MQREREREIRNVVNVHFDRKRNETANYCAEESNVLEILLFLINPLRRKIKMTEKKKIVVPVYILYYVIVFFFFFALHLCRRQMQFFISMDEQHFLLFFILFFYFIVLLFFFGFYFHSNMQNVYTKN